MNTLHIILAIQRAEASGFYYFAAALKEMLKRQLAESQHEH